MLRNVPKHASWNLLPSFAPPVAGFGFMIGSSFAALLLAAATAVLAACAWTPVDPYKGANTASDVVYVATLGWHSEIGLQAGAADAELRPLEGEFPGATYFMFGWGLRDFYMAANPGVMDLLRGLVPGPAVMLVRGLQRSPAETYGAAQVYAVAVSREGIANLVRYFKGYLDTDGTGHFHRLGDGPFPDSAFYDAMGTYSVANTCNTWTAEALNVAGVPIGANGVVFADELAERIRAAAPPPRAP